MMTPGPSGGKWKLMGDYQVPVLVATQVKECDAQALRAVPELVAACELFLKFDGENCQTGETHYDDVKAAIMDALAKAQPQGAKS